MGCLASAVLLPYRLYEVMGTATLLALFEVLL